MIAKKEEIIRKYIKIINKSTHSFIKKIKASNINRRKLINMGKRC